MQKELPPQLMLREILVQKREMGIFWLTALPEQRPVPRVHSQFRTMAEVQVGLWGEVSKLLPGSVTLRSNLTFEEPAMTA